MHVADEHDFVLDEGLFDRGLSVAPLEPGDPEDGATGACRARNGYAPAYSHTPSPSKTSSQS